MTTVIAQPRTFVPPSDAAWFVESLWAVRAPGGAPDRVELPDGRPLVVLRLGTPAEWVDPLTYESVALGSVVSGLRTGPVVVRQPGDAWAVGARLTPYGLAALSPGRLLVDDQRPIGDLLGLDVPQLEAQVRDVWRHDDEAGAAAAARVLVAALVSAVRRPAPRQTLDAVRAAVDLADVERGLLRPVDLARELGCSLADLHRWFVEEIGVEPSTYLSMVRLSRAVGELGAAPDGPASAVVAALRDYADAGYSPREVERFTGMEPLELRRAVRGMEELVRSV